METNYPLPIPPSLRLREGGNKRERVNIYKYRERSE